MAMTATAKAARTLLSDIPDGTEMLCHFDKVIEETDPGTGEKTVTVVDQLYNIRLFMDRDRASGKPVIIVYPTDKA